MRSSTFSSRCLRITFLILLLTVQAAAKDAPLRVITWPATGTPAVRFTFSKFKALPGMGTMHAYVMDTMAENLSPKLIKSAKKGDAYGPLYGMDAYPDGDFKACRSESATQGTQYAMTSTDNWTDWRGTSNDPSMISDPVHAWNFYQAQNPADATRSQTKKQVRIKAIWSLNSGTY